MPSPSPLKIMSWNVNSVNARLERLTALLTRHTPDILCLQELKCEESRFPFESMKALGYTAAAVSGQKTYNGVAIVTKYPISEIRRPFQGTELATQARAIGAFIQSVWVYSVYVPNGQEVGCEKFAYKLQWMHAFGGYLKSAHSPKDEVAVCGDYNVAPTSLDVHAPDLWNEKILCSTEERNALAHIVGDYEDTFRKQHADGGQFTWWDYRDLGFPLNKGLRIDLILASRPLAERCRRTEIDRNERKGSKPSDHAPVLAEFV
ncbi:MAG: exodeoxyribonuclease III [Deltaproteobacteria bacterium]|nr:exodeoxyribonuclease III [Deltaproteobacteria bacterium]MBI3296352.1 exodeoxyribonuclease III [Deltaproteobacteria bacterium]